MILTDKIYGTFTLKDALVEEIVNSKTFQRLQGVWQHGLPPRYLHGDARDLTFTRYDHSIGVFLLLRKLGASRDEQIAGLLHDASHMAMSHVYDWIMGENYLSENRDDEQDNRHVAYLKKTEIPMILEKHNLSVDKILNHKEFTLLDREVPEVCVDRLDYCLREIPVADVREIVNSLSVYKGEIVVRQENTALKLAEIYMRRNREFWASYESSSRYHIIARTMKYALQKGFVKPEDFLGIDEDLFAKLESLKDDQYIAKNISLLANPILPTSGPHSEAKLKFRYIDPKYWREGRMYRLSESNPTFASMVEAERGIYSKPTKVYDGE